MNDSQTQICAEHAKKFVGKRPPCRFDQSNAATRKPAASAARGLLAAFCYSAIFSSLLAVLGCERTSTAVKASSGGGYSSSQWSDDLFNFAINNLNQLEDNDCQEMSQSTRLRLGAIAKPELAPGVIPSSPLLASWPEPDMLRQVVTRLNQWVDSLGKSTSASRDPMLSALSPAAVKLPMFTELDEPHFNSYDGYMLMEAVWTRDVARWAKGNTSDDLAVACNLFDWTVRNIQLDYDRPDHVPQVPWETLFTGHGTALERAWTYVLILRQCDIDAGILALPIGGASPADKSAKEDKGSADAKSNADVRPWCVAVLLGDKEKQLYLFDPQLGLPVPSPKGISAGKVGQLEVRPATFEQVVQHPELLDRLARDSDRPHWARKADLKKAVVMIEASPLYLEPRAKRVEASLNGERRMVLSAEPSLQAARFKAAGIGDVRLWDLPYKTLESRMAMTPVAASNVLVRYLRFIGFGGGSLYKGRILHLKGKFFDEKGAIAYYQKARPRTRNVMAQESQRVEDWVKSWETQLNDRKITVTKAIKDEIAQDAVSMFKTNLAQILQGRVDAAYWLGQIEYEQEEYDSAIDYFVKRTLQVAGSMGFWETGARYNIARCQEMNGKWQEAVKEYETNLILRNDDGCLLRARWLKESHGVQADQPQAEKKESVDEPAKKADEKKADEKKADEKKADEKKADEKKADEKKADEKKADEKKADEKKADEKKADEKKADEKKAADSKSTGREP